MKAVLPWLVMVLGMLGAASPWLSEAAALDDTSVKGGGDSFEVAANESARDSADEPEVLGGGASTTSSPGSWRYVPYCVLGGAALCVEGTECGDGGELYAAMYTPPRGVERFVSTMCAEEGEAPVVAARPQITNAMVMRAFRRVDVPAAKLIVQPPGGKTLVNFDTLFHTEAESFTRTVRLLGQRVDLEITPSSFTWQHGDGTAQTTGNPGVAYAESRPMSDYVSHRYADAHVTVRPSVDTTYTARFRINGGAWRDVVGTVTVDGAPVDVRVVEGRPALVDAG